jgi:putative membrane protein
MQTFRMIPIATIALSALVACKSNNQSGASDSAGGTAATGAGGAASSPSAAGGASGSDSTARAAGSSANASSGATTDANILAKTKLSDSAEVAVAKYVSQNSTTASVKSFARLLQRDHGKGISTVEAMAKKLSINPQLPAGDTTAQKAGHLLDRLQSLKGHDLDTAFVNNAIADHQHDIDETQQMTSSAQKPEVKALLQKELPELRKHLEAAQKLSTSMSGAATQK